MRFYFSLSCRKEIFTASHRMNFSDIFHILKQMKSVMELKTAPDPASPLPGNQLSNYSFWATSHFLSKDASWLRWKHRAPRHRPASLGREIGKPGISPCSPVPLPFPLLLSSLQWNSSQDLWARFMKILARSFNRRKERKLWHILWLHFESIFHIPW